VCSSLYGKDRQFLMKVKRLYVVIYNAWYWDCCILCWKLTLFSLLNRFLYASSVDFRFFFFFFLVLCVCVCLSVCLCDGARVRRRTCARVALLNQHATHMRYIVVCDFSGSIIFFDILINSTIFWKRYWAQNMFWFSVQRLFETFLISKENSARYCHKCKNVFM
jgi:hypothetical protein